MTSTAEKQLILIVDDVKDNILVLGQILQQEYKLIFATNGQSALTIAEQQQPQIILLDVVMPDMDGYEVCARLKASELTEKIPVIFVTAKDEEDDELRGLEFGAVDYITKPLRPKIVKLRVSAHLNSYQCKQKEKELVKAKMQAEAFSKAKSEFLSRMSHELRTPMNAVLGFAQLLEMDDLTEDQKDSVSEILNAGEHLLELINDVLELSKIESGKLELTPIALDLNEVIENCISLTKHAAAKYNITINNQMDCDAYKLFADSLRLKQVILNLLSNAVKYNRNGGSVILSCEPLADDYIRVNITDTGYGLTVEQVKRLFNSFERLGIKGNEIEGAGIGLCITKQLVETMGGRLEVSSQVDEGSCFSFILPCFAPELVVEV
ncbi:MAG: response regulator [Methylococcaceae bacterium]|nr:response regulator [Methylococcaceae bacterium]